MKSARQGRSPPKLLPEISKTIDLSRQSTSGLVQLACILEAATPKPGNVHPGQSFDDLTYQDFVKSAAAIAPVFGKAASRSIGRTVLEAVSATRRIVGKNTNLGIILLLAPLAATPRVARKNAGTALGRRELRKLLRQRLAALTRRDAKHFYEAIRLASPGGMGTVEEGDLRDTPTGSVLEMMALARRRDLVARQYCSAFREVLDDGLPALTRALARGLDLEQAVILCHLSFLSRHGDSLIARKCGAAASQEAARRARQVVEADWPAGRGSNRRLSALDRWLRSDGNQRNPGTSADLTAAVLFLALGSGIIQGPLALPYR